MSSQSRSRLEILHGLVEPSSSTRPTTERLPVHCLCASSGQPLCIQDIVLGSLGAVPTDQDHCSVKPKCVVAAARAMTIAPNLLRTEETRKLTCKAKEKDEMVLKKSSGLLTVGSSPK